MAHTLTVNATRTNLTTALVTSLTQPYSPSPFPQLAFGETVSAELYVADGDSYDARSGVAGYTPRIVLTLADQKPQSGTFTISDGTDTTTALDYDATETEIETALNALNTDTGPYGDLVTVQKEQNGTFSVLFDSNGSQTELTVDDSGISPTSSTSVFPIIEGGAFTRNKQLIHIKADPLLFADGGAEITNGWRMTLNANNANFLAAIADGDISANYAIQLVAPDSTTDTLATGPVILKANTFDVAALGGITYPQIPMLDDVVIQRLDITSLSPGIVSPYALNYIQTVDLETNYTVLTGVTIGLNAPGKTWTLKSGTDANNPAGGVVRPLDYNKTTNAKIWKVTQ